MNVSYDYSKKLLAASLLVILVIGSLTLLAYNEENKENKAMKDSVKRGMMPTAGVMATQINPADLSGLRPGYEGSGQYRAVAWKLQNPRSMNDHILNAYIPKVNPDKTITFLVDDLYPDDPHGSARIGEVSTAPDTMEILARRRS